ncbi:MAG: aminodeoxychorismate/anthranilate synthase component II [Alphaproteobacteria bacterium]|nr:aminodeoxychorismate/anthranilate synthase component II [Alphaproteobacteria bacterium]
MFLLIDNYDSFTYNLVHYLGEMGAEVVVKRNESLSADEALGLGAQGIVISPGPCDPDRSGICLDLIVKNADDGATPVLGVCLGHQAVAQAFGGKVVRAPAPMHGKVSKISHQGKSVLKDLPDPLTATRYHSLIVEKESLPGCLEVTAESDDGLIMGLAHKELPVHGVQFHPESIATEHGHRLLGNFLELVTGKSVTPPTLTPP